MKKIIYVCGNPMLEEDNLPIKLIKDLEKTFPEIKFEYIDPNENLKPDKGSLVIIDTALGIKEVTIIRDIKQIASSPAYTMHDFDLATNLKLLERLGMLKKITIFAIPSGIKKSTALEQLIKNIKSNIELITN